MRRCCRNRLVARRYPPGWLHAASFASTQQVYVARPFMCCCCIAAGCCADRYQQCPAAERVHQLPEQLHGRCHTGKQESPLLVLLGHMHAYLCKCPTVVHACMHACMTSMPCCSRWHASSRPHKYACILEAAQICMHPSAATSPPSCRNR